MNTRFHTAAVSRLCPGIRAGAGAVLRPLAGTALLVILLSLLLSANAFSAMTVDNTAKASFTVGPMPVAVNSNLASIVVRTPSTIKFLEYAPLAAGAVMENVSATSYLATSGYTPLPGPITLGSATPLDLSQPVPLVETGVYHINEPIFIRLTDHDQNLDPSVTETVVVTLTLDGNGDSETLLFTETGPNTGVFTGSIQSTGGPAVAGNGQLSVDPNSAIQARYTDPVDGTDTSTTAALVDPFGIVFDSATGKPVDGVVVTLVDAATGLPATVIGDDGMSAFPATVTTGATVTDAGGRRYDFPPGGFRYPFVSPGSYRFQVAPPAGYSVPSTVADDLLQKLPGGPFALVTPGSRLEPFTIMPGPPIHIDIPLDSLSAALWLQKSAGKGTVAVGDFLTYQLNLQNTDAVATATGVAITDTLPLGFRYRQGSTKLNGAAAPDPAISRDGRTLTFAVGDLAARATASIRYVVEVAAGARPGTATNRATARSAAGAASNLATAAVQVRSDFMNSRSIIMGEVIAGACGVPQGEKPAGVAGIRIILEDGSYIVTDKNGMYHFEGVIPGNHVVQMDLGSVPEKYEVIACEENSRFAGNPYSQFVDLQGGTLWRADFHLRLKPAATGEAGLELRSVLKKAEAGSETVEYSAPIRIGAVPVRNLRLTVMLPDGFSYQTGTSSLNGAPTPDPTDRENALTFGLGDLPGNWEGTVRFNAALPLAGASGELATRALLTFDTPVKKNERTPVADNVLARRTVEERRAAPDIVLRPRFAVLSAELSGEDRKALDRVIDEMKQIGVKQITVTGHTDANPILGRGMEKFRDNYALSEARAGAVGRHIAGGLKLAPEQVTYVGKGPDEPVASNETEEGRALNRRVELTVKSEKLVVSSEIVNKKDLSGAKTVATVGLRPGETWVAAAAEKGAAGGKDMPEYNAAWLDTAPPGPAWLWPPEGYHPSLPSVKLAVKQDPRKTLKLFLNGAEVDPLYLDGTVKRRDNTVAVSVWRGVHVADGDNLFEAAQFDETGAETVRLKRIIHYSTPPVRAEFIAAKSRLAADGKNPPVIAVRLTDKDGHPAREGVIGEYAVDPPFFPRQRAEELQQNRLSAPAKDRLKYQVGEDGVALIELQPTTRTGEAVVRLNLVSGAQEVRGWLRPDFRDWILVGLAEGTAGYNVVEKNMVSAAASGVDDRFEEDGRVAFYAKGAIKGEWLLTIAYDSAKKSTGSGGNSLFQTIDPNAFYTLYGDGTRQGYDAASARKLYLKIERDQFYALFGDFNTGLTVTELSRYSRSLNGFKSEYQGREVEVNVFGAETGQAFVKDELRGDGTSGLYRLSRRNMVINSEKVTIETRDRFHSEIIIESRTLSRFADYSIDFDAGTLFFKEPIRSRDDNFNPIYIVVEYETLDAGAESLTYGGRVGAKLLDDNLRSGFSYIHEGQGNGRGNLYGVDASCKIGANTTLKGEVARTDTDFGGAAREGNAWLAELQHNSPKLLGKLYFREQDEGFGLGQQNGSETGTRKLGCDAAYKLTDAVGLSGQAYRQYNLATGAVQDVAEGKTTFSSGPYSAHLGLRYANDLLGDGSNKSSEQLTMGGSWLTLNKRLNLHVDHDQSIGGNANASFPTRTAFGADFKLTEKFTLLAQQEITSGVGADTYTTSAGMRATPWEGGAVNSSMGRNLNENGERVFALFGLKQTWKITDKWSVDGGVDRSQTIRKPGSYQFNVNVPPASGENQDFTAVSLGTAYQEKKWSWNSRLEVRTSAPEDKWGILTAFVGEPGEGWGWSARCQIFDTRSALGASKLTSDLRLGFAYRPPDTRWIVLDRLDLLIDRERGTASSLDSRRIVNNLNANFKPDRENQLSLLYGAKYVLETIDGRDYSGYTDLIGIEGRHDLTRKWDIGLRGSLLHSWGPGQLDYSAGTSIGYNAVRNAWISLGYNFIGFTDRDFSAADYTAQGPFVRFRFKLDQRSVKDALSWLGAQ